MSKSSLKLDMQRDDCSSQTPALAKAAPVVKSFAQSRVLRVVQWNELCLAVAAGAQALHVEARARLVKVKLRPLATVRARDNAKITRFQKTVAERAVAQARRFQAVSLLGSGAAAKSARRLCRHEESCTSSLPH